MKLSDCWHVTCGSPRLPTSGSLVMEIAIPGDPPDRVSPLYKASAGGAQRIAMAMLMTSDPLVRCWDTGYFSPVGCGCVSAITVKPFRRGN